MPREKALLIGVLVFTYVSTRTKYVLPLLGNTHPWPQGGCHVVATSWIGSRQGPVRSRCEALHTDTSQCVCTDNYPMITTVDSPAVGCGCLWDIFFTLNRSSCEPVLPLIDIFCACGLFKLGMRMAVWGMLYADEALYRDHRKGWRRR